MLRELNATGCRKVFDGVQTGFVPTKMARISSRPMRGNAVAYRYFCGEGCAPGRCSRLGARRYADSVASGPSIPRACGDERPKALVANDVELDYPRERGEPGARTPRYLPTECFPRVCR